MADALQHEFGTLDGVLTGGKIFVPETRVLPRSIILLLLLVFLLSRTRTNKNILFLLDLVQFFTRLFIGLTSISSRY